MRGADEAYIRELVAEVRIHPGLAPRDRQSTIQLLYIVSAVILGSETARRIFHVESLIQDPNVQALIREWEDKGRAEGHAEGRTEGHTEGRAEGRAEEARSLLLKVLGARSLPVTSDVRARIDSEADLARLESWLEAAVTATALSDVFRDS
jgi:predicted transposase YdaD